MSALALLRTHSPVDPGMRILIARAIAGEGLQLDRYLDKNIPENRLWQLPEAPIFTPHTVSDLAPAYQKPTFC